MNGRRKRRVPAVVLVQPIDLALELVEVTDVAEAQARAAHVHACRGQLLHLQWVWDQECQTGVADMIRATTGVQLQRCAVLCQLSTSAKALCLAAWGGRRCPTHAGTQMSFCRSYVQMHVTPVLAHKISGSPVVSSATVLTLFHTRNIPRLASFMLTCFSRTSPQMGPSRWSCMMDCAMLAVLLLRRPKKLRHIPLGLATAMSRPTWRYAKHHRTVQEHKPAHTCHRHKVLDVPDERAGAVYPLVEKLVCTDATACSSTELD